jgi:hypothetical protein
VSHTRRIVRRDTCNGCGGELVITRAELRAGVAHCSCGLDLALAVHEPGDGPTRAMQVVEVRPLIGAPPSPQVVERFTPQPTLIVTTGPTEITPWLVACLYAAAIIAFFVTFDAPAVSWAVLVVPLALGLSGPKRPIKRLALDEHTVEVSGAGVERHRVPLAALEDVGLPLAELDAPTRTWIRAWIRERTPRP